MIDIHCHILHDIDDGAQELDTSVRMCHVAAENGIEKIVATPHVTKLSDISKFIERRDERLSELRHAVAQRGIPVELYPGAEVYISDDLFYSDDLSKLTINSSRYILVEFDFFDLTANRFLKYLDELYGRKLVPIIAHPERYKYLQHDYDLVNYLAERDVIFQINAVNLTGESGREEFDLAHQMAVCGVASLIGTDAHSYHGRANDLFEMINSFPPDIGSRSLDNMLNDAPNAVLNDRTIPFSYKSPIRKRRLF